MTVSLTKLDKCTWCNERTHGPDGCTKGCDIGRFYATELVWIPDRSWFGTVTRISKTPDMSEPFVTVKLPRGDVIGRYEDELDRAKCCVCGAVMPDYDRLCHPCA